MAPRTPNYRHARGDRDRTKQQKKQEKLRKLEEETAKRKEQPTAGPTTVTPPADPRWPS